MKVTPITVGQMAVNCYFIIDPDSSHALIIDPGDDAEAIIDHLKKDDLTPQAILATHGHFDHILAVNELKLAFNIPFYIHQADLSLVQKMRQNTKHFLGFDPGPAPIPDQFFDPINKLVIGYLSLDILSTPGHTPGSICLYGKKDGFLVAGDLIFANGGVGRTDFSYSNHQDLMTSINTILKLPKATTIYSGHGPSTTIEAENIHHQL